MDFCNEDIEILGFLGLMLCVYVATKKTFQRRNKRRFKTRPINRARKVAGGFNYYLKMKTLDDEQFFKYTRLTKAAFDKLINILKPKLQRQPRSDGISPEERLIITLQ